MDDILDRNLDKLIGEILASYRADGRMQRIGQRFLPSRGRIIEMLEEVRQLLFPGYFGRKALTEENIKYHVGSLLPRLGEDLSTQINSCLCYAEGSSPPEGSEAKAAEIAQRFLQRIPAIRRMLALDAQAAYDGDPAAKSIEEVIYCYPGFFAITVYRVAHELLSLGVPLMPRIMTEYAHSFTGMDIHPGARIGKSFFIDHGTGVVIGETTRIGDNVKIYQGVTLGALELPQGRAGQGHQGPPAPPNHRGQRDDLRQRHHPGRGDGHRPRRHGRRQHLRDDLHHRRQHRHHPDAAPGGPPKKERRR